MTDVLVWYFGDWAIIFCFASVWWLTTQNLVFCEILPALMPNSFSGATNSLRKAKQTNALEYLSEIYCRRRIYQMLPISEVRRLSFRVLDDWRFRKHRSMVLSHACFSRFRLLLPWAKYRLKFDSWSGIQTNPASFSRRRIWQFPLSPYSECSHQLNVFALSDCQNQFSCRLGEFAH